MIDSLDAILGHLLRSQVTGLRFGIPTSVVDGQVAFAPPDQEWARHVRDLQRNVLNVYLVDLRENRELRSNQRTQIASNGVVYEDPAPTWLDCHYLISAWSPITPITPQVAPTLDEHALLYEATAVLLNNAPINPSRIYPAGSDQLRAWEPYSSLDMPMRIAPAEGFIKLAEFWSGMGQSARWRPTLYLIVTIPVVMMRQFSGHMVTTIISQYGVIDQMEYSDTLIEIGGVVSRLVNNTSVPLQNATVALETTSGELLESTITNALGRFTFSRMTPGQYQLRALAAGLGQHRRPNVEVPSPTGEYDLQFP